MIWIKDIYIPDIKLYDLIKDIYIRDIKLYDLN